MRNMAAFVIVLEANTTSLAALFTELKLDYPDKV